VWQSPPPSLSRLSPFFPFADDNWHTCRPPAQFIPPVPDPYEYIIFRASEVKDLSVDEQVAPRASVHDDPAVLGVSPTSTYPFSTMMKPFTDVYTLSESAKTVWIFRCLPSDLLPSLAHEPASDVRS
jgi:hypothetical protein